MDLASLVTKELSSATSELLATKPIERVSKNPELSVRARELGNRAFRSSGRRHDAEHHERILHCYATSLAFAPSDSEYLAFAWANKSALLLHLGKFEDCVKDADRALELAVTPNALRVKLLCRKLECLVGVGELDGRMEMLEEIDRCMLLVEEGKREALSKMINKVKAFVKRNDSAVAREDYETEHLRARALKESKGTFDSVSLTRSGPKHLIATEDIQPGQLILVSKPYARVANFKQFQSYCAHCADVLWSSLACEHCCFSLYCSEACKREAWSGYHEIECRCLQFVLCDGLVDYQTHVALRAVVMGVEEFGSVEALIEKAEDDDGEFDGESFKSLLRIKDREVGPAVLDSLVAGACRSVIALARYTSFFGSAREFVGVEGLLDDANVVSVAALLLRISLIAFRNGRKIAEGSTACKNGNDQVTCSSSIPCCERGFSVDVLGSFLPHSCSPNVRSVMIDRGKELWYALQPIAKGEPLLDCYKSCFFEMDKSRRSSLIARVLNRDCNCVACENNWPAVLAPGGRVMTYQDMSHIMAEGIKNKNICGKFLIMIGENERYTQRTADDLTKIMTAMFEVEQQPSKLLCSMICILRFVFDRLHGIKFRMPSQCRVLPS